MHDRDIQADETQDVYLNYPVHRSLSLNYGNGSTYRPTLEEEVLEEDETTSDSDRIPAFHGYSGSGNASAEYVYVGTSLCVSLAICL
jgi:N-acetylated-alpha-linked acidic dipeptidase